MNGWERRILGRSGAKHSQYIEALAIEMNRIGLFGNHILKIADFVEDDPTPSRSNRWFRENIIIYRFSSNKTLNRFLRFLGDPGAELAWGKRHVA